MGKTSVTKYEQTIAEIEDFIDNCKKQKFSGNNIVVDKRQLEEYIAELRVKNPEEITKYKKMVANREAILDEAQSQAEALIERVRRQTEELVSEHEIMQQAYEVAQETVDNASEQAQQILDDAVNDANEIRMGAMQYTDDILANLQNIIINTMDNITARYDGLMKTLNTTLEVVNANRASLSQEEASKEELSYEQEEDNGENYEETFSSEEPDDTDGVDDFSGYEDYTVKLD